MVPVAPYLAYLQDGAAQKQLVLPLQAGKEKYDHVDEIDLDDNMNPEMEAKTPDFEQNDDDIQQQYNGEEELFDEMEMDALDVAGVHDDEWDDEIKDEANEMDQQSADAASVSNQHESGPSRQHKGMTTSSDDPDFITHYHGHSRLHYLSTWGR